MTYSRPSALKPPSPLSNRSESGRGRALRRRRPRQARDQPRQPRRLAPHARELLADASLRAVQHDARRRQQQDAVGLGDPSGRDDEHAARPISPGVGTGLGDRAVDVIVGLGHVAFGPLVQDHHVDGDAASPPETVCAQHRWQDGRVLGRADAHEEDREISGDRVLPQGALSEAVPGEDGGGSPQSVVGVQEKGEQRRRRREILRGERQIGHLGLAALARQLEAPLEGRKRAVAAGEGQDALA